ncbi:MAG: GTP 3',8-cyclase MoaA [Coriobacteriaceae bacterium]|nr:GTP 3',8-cyclase MoaA [Coriobacteriaceae bacterium]
MIDRFGRNIDYLRISVTDRCNLRCVYCMPEEGVPFKSHEIILSIEEIARVVRVAAENGVTRVRLTGGEPLVRKGIIALVDDISHTPGIEDVSMTTNGILLPRFGEDLREAGLTRVNISLDTLDPEKYRQITRLGHIDDALAGIDCALELGFDPVKINAVAVRSLDQDFLAFARLSIDRPLHVRFIEYMPVGLSSGGTGAGWTAEDSIPTDELIGRIDTEAEAAGIGALQPVEAEDAPGGTGPARYYRFAGAQGTVGFISGVSNHFCSTCNRLRLTADGKLRPCLFSDREVDVVRALREIGTDEAIEHALYEAVGIKPEEHEGDEGTERRMSQIGG